MKLQTAVCFVCFVVFSIFAKAESITGFQELQLCQKEAVIKKNIENAEKGRSTGKYKIGTTLHNFPYDGDYIEYLRSGNNVENILVKYYFFGNKNTRTLYLIDMLWEYIDDTRARDYYYSNSAIECAKYQANQLALGLGKKYGISPKRVNETEYQIKDEKTNNVLVIFIVPANEDLRMKFGSSSKTKGGYYIRVAYINVPIFNFAQLSQEREAKERAEKRGRETGL